MMLLIANNSASKSNKKRGWWTRLLFTATFASAKLVYKHVLRQNIFTQAHRNISLTLRPGIISLFVCARIKLHALIKISPLEA
ncbi:hypothetical protein MANES_03G160850v8 [Manihot esculenta]|uniref:Uncharacterized protein n=1 Tax=Manihot esculenta TaxID=3983 RepID=A0ACB7I1B1_MANES|nr:hypothetical protein MANES_03G160850v8 [Manihot esculenta]